MAATTQAIYQSNIPEELLPYQRTLLDQAAAFTDIEKYPYQQYQGERVAQMSPLQQQALESAGQMGVAGQIGAATDIAGAAGLGALGTQYDPMRYRSRSFTQPGIAGSFMSPYMQNVVDVQQREAKRQADIAATARGAQAARAGAFGGARQAIENAEANRALQTQLGGIQAQGLQSAFQQAQQQFNQEQQARQAAAQLREQSRQFGAGLGMQGLQTGLQAANTLGNLGQQQFGQTQGAIQTQAALGQQEQQQAQNILNAQYQDFLNYQNYPYRQLGFMSDIIRGTPLTQTSATMYQAPPSTTQSLMSLGLGAYGMNQMFPSLFKAGGGSVQSYADGGSVFSRANKERIVGGLHPDALPRAMQGAMARGDMETAAAAQDEMSLDAAIRRGIAAAAPDDIGVGYADGGIVAFAGGGAPVQEAPKTMQEALNRMFGAGLPPRKEGKELVEAVKGRKSGLEELYGASEAVPIYEQMIREQQSRLPEIEQQGRGLTALRMAAALQKAGVTPGDRYAGMFEAAASGAEKAQAAKQAAQSEMMKARLLMAQAKDARAMGMTDKAFALQTEAENRQDKAFELNQAATRQAVQTLGTSETHAADRASREKISQAQIAAQRDIAKQRAAAGSGAMRGYMTALSRAQDRAQKIANERWKDMTDRKSLMDQGFKTFDQYYNHVLKGEMKRATPIYDVTPEDDED